ncbi:uncharacterized protein [Arachis hypogaea]|uniref:uncharacterized protein n=1 Tax=Arachis hypogaea TaxID=3818 RepID=UPI003B217B26
MGIAEDVLVAIKDLVFPVDFYILEMPPIENRSSSSILLCRPFLKTSKFKLDAFTGTYSFEVGDKTIKFNLEEAMRHPPEDNFILRCDVIDEVVVEGNQRFPVIIASELSSQEEEKLLEVLREHKKAIGWSLADIVGIDPRTSMHHIFLQEGARTVRQPQRRINPTILDVVKKDVTRLLDAGIIYPISDSEWVSLVEVVPKKSGITVVKKDDGEVVTTRAQNAWRENLAKVLERCVNTNLVLNFEKCHFMVRQGIVLGHIVSDKGISVDLAKVDVITSLPHPSFVREVHSFLRHVGFYSCFIKNFSKIALPLSCLLQKDVDFEFDSARADAFEELRRALTTAPIVRGPNKMQPFEIMCDASNHAVGATLAQRDGKLPYIIAYS